MMLSMLFCGFAGLSAQTGVRDIERIVQELGVTPLQIWRQVSYGGMARNYILTDKSGMVRLNYMDLYEQDLYKQLAYFDPQGRLVKLLFYQSSHSDWSGYGELCLDGKAVIKAEGRISDLMEDQDIHKQETLARLTNSLLSSIKHKGIFDPAKEEGWVAVSELQRSQQPSPGQIRLLKAFQVNVREKPTLKSKVVHRLDTLAYVEIIRAAGTETLAPWGTYPWYRIRFRKVYFQEEMSEGYIFGAFLEPCLYLEKGLE